jgi:hypothetical protein
MSRKDSVEKFCNCNQYWNYDSVGSGAAGFGIWEHYHYSILSSCIEPRLGLQPILLSASVQPPAVDKGKPSLLLITANSSSGSLTPLVD